MNKNDRKILDNVANRHFRKKNGLCIAEGLRCAQEALQRRSGTLRALFCSAVFCNSRHFPDFQKVAEEVGSRIIELSDEDFNAISETETPQGVIAVLRIPEYREPDVAGTPFTLILDQVADPGNLGTILRTAWAVGLNSCWLVKGSADPFSPKAVRSGMGAQFALDIHLFDTLEDAVQKAKALGAGEVWCTMPGEGVSIFSREFVCRGSALIIGNEANGISNPAVGRAVTIPMPGHAESLNAAQAATVFLVEALNPHIN